MMRLSPWISPSRGARPPVRAAMPPAWRPWLGQPPQCRVRRRGLRGPRGGRDLSRLLALARDDEDQDAFTVLSGASSGLVGRGQQVNPTISAPFFMAALDDR